MGLEQGTEIGRDFRIVRQLGEGGMGAVYVALQKSTGKERALKTMHPSLVANESLRSRFEQEARIGARVDSDRIVDVVAAGVDDTTKTPWLAMELLKGETLATRIATRGALDAPALRHLLVQLGEALAAAHAAGVVHRDLKPENLFLARSRRADEPFQLKVLDFGIAKLLASSVTGPTANLGTPLWMAPEQTDPTATITPAADIWAFGLVAFQAFTGKPYWVGTDSLSVPALLRQIVLEPLPSASARAREIGSIVPPRSFDDWFAACVARDPRTRFADGAQALHALEPILAELPSTAGDADAFARTEPLAAMGTPLPTPIRAAMTTHGGASVAVVDAPQAKPSSRSKLAPFAAAAAVAALAFGGYFGSRSTFAKVPAPSTTLAASAPTSAPATATKSTRSAVLPQDSSLVTSTPVQLKWAVDGSGDRETEVEVVAENGSGVASIERFPREMTYAMWPWKDAGSPPAPGRYKWRVHEVGDPNWSSWSVFAVYPSLLDRVVDQKVLLVGMEPTYHAPFVYLDMSTKKVVGFDVELAEMLAAELGVEMKRVPREWNALFTDVDARTLDVVVSAVTISKDREQKYSFSSPYMSTGVVLTVRDGVKVAPSGKGSRLGAQRNTTAATTARRTYPEADVRDFDTLDSALAALSGGEIDGLLADESVIKVRPELATGKLRIEGKRLTHDRYGVMMHHGDDRLRGRIDEALANIRSSGRLAALEEKYGL